MVMERYYVSRREWLELQEQRRNAELEIRQTKIDTALNVLRAESVQAVTSRAITCLANIDGVRREEVIPAGTSLFSSQSALLQEAALMKMRQIIDNHSERLW